MNPILRTGVILVAIAEGLAAYVPHVPDRGPIALLGALSVWSFVTAGLIAWDRRPENRTGALMVLVGLAHPLGALLRHETPFLWTASWLVSPSWIVIFVYLLLSFPRGVLTGKIERFVLVGASFQAFFWNPVIMLFWKSSRPPYGSPGTPEGLNLLLLTDDPSVGGSLLQLSSWLDLVTLAILVLVLAGRWRRASPPAKRVLAPVFVTGLFSIVFTLMAIEAGNFWPSASLAATLKGLTPVAVATVPFGFLFGLLRARSRRAKVGDLVVELGGMPNREGFQAALAKALGDPSLIVGFWSSEARAYLGSGKEPLPIADTSDQRAITYLERGNQPLAAIVHDRALLDDPSLIQAVTAAARLAVENELLQAKVQEQLHEVRESRARIVQAADEERRRVERNLHDGAQQRLVSLSLALRSTESMLGDSDPAIKSSLQAAAKELEEAIVEIRELARGIHPSILTDEGLWAAAEALTERSSIPVEVEEFPSDRLPAGVEATGYFIIAEALANAEKHSEASVLRISARRSNTTLIIEIADDGVGGAIMDTAGGLRGLADRVEALDGKLEVLSPPGAGTRITAQIPCVS